MMPSRLRAASTGVPSTKAWLAASKADAFTSALARGVRQNAAKVNAMHDHRIQRPGEEQTKINRRWLRHDAAGGFFSCDDGGAGSSAGAASAPRFESSLSFLMVSITSGLMRRAPEAKPLAISFGIFMAVSISSVRH